MAKLAVLGAGAWGSALAIALARRHDVTLWGRDAGQVAQMQQERENRRYLCGAPFPARIRVSSDLAETVAAADLAICVVPTQGLRQLAQQLHALRPSLGFVWACKGLEAESYALPHEVVAEVCGKQHPHGVLSGPSFAKEVAAGLPAAMTLAAADRNFARETADLLHGMPLRIYTSTDVVGVEVGGALKNVMAIAAGISDGLAFGLNARAALMTRGLAEIARFGIALGGRVETFMGLAGAGDLILTCTGDLSRNRQVGMRLAQNVPLANIIDELGHVAEGVQAARAVWQRATQMGLDLPITEGVCSILEGSRSAHAVVEQLLARDQKEEFALPHCTWLS